jgi:hypothetical protein
MFAEGIARTIDTENPKVVVEVSEGLPVHRETVQRRRFHNWYQNV